MSPPAREPTLTTSTPEPATLLADLFGVPFDPVRFPAVAAYVAEVLASADLLRAIDLGDEEPGPAFDARWPGDTR